MANPSPDSSAGAPPSGLPRRNYRYLVVFVVGLLLFFSLLSYDDGDTAFLEGGFGDTAVLSNWMGYTGAYCSRFLLLACGFTAFLLLPLVMLSALRRFLGGPGVRAAGWDYWIGFVLYATGFCMFFGNWPDFLGDEAERFNIARTTGGVIGQRLSDPEQGWMQIILNPTGNILVGSLLVLIGIWVVWRYDWGNAVMALWHRRKKPAPAAPEADAAAKRGFRVRPGPSAPRETPAEDGTPLLFNPAPEAAPARGTPSPAAAPTPSATSAKAPAAAAPAATAKGPYVLPGSRLLTPHDDRETAVEEDEVEEKKRILQATLDNFGIEAKAGEATCGPRVTLFEVTPAPGVKVEKITGITNNLAMELSAVSLRVLAPIPGRNTVGIEVPNAKAATVSLRGLLETTAWTNSNALVPLVLGRSISGGVVVLDLAKAPHLLIAGATGSGKSVCINALIMSMLMRFTPDELRLILVDPKVVELRTYEKLPHLVVPVINDVKKVPLALRWLTREMERRYRVLAKVGARNLESFNNRPAEAEPVMDDEGKPIPARLPFIVLIIDELADIMMTSKEDVEKGLARIAQLSRAVGIHTIVATQRPSVNVITGIIKANFPTRIAFQVTSLVDSRTIIDGKGAETLLGRGDMLFKPPGASKLERIQSAFVDDDEIDRVVANCAEQAPQSFEEDVFKAAAAADGVAGAAAEGDMAEADEELIQRAIEVILRDRRATTSYVQRCLRIGYNRAALIMEILESRGVVGPQVGTGPREILMTGNGGAAGEGEGGPDPFADDDPVPPHPNDHDPWAEEKPAKEE